MLTTVSPLSMSMKIPAYGVRVAKAPLEPLKIERRKPGPNDVEIEILYCGVCHECRAGHEMFCEKGVTFTFDSLDQNTKTWTYGGYSTDIVVDERYVLRVPKDLDPARAAPLMCAGITTYSPLHQFECKPGD